MANALSAGFQRMAHRARPTLVGSRDLASDLTGTPVTVNLLLPGGATLTGMIPQDLSEEMRSRLLPASVMAEPIRWLCSPAAAGVHDERIVASDFAGWLAARSG